MASTIEDLYETTSKSMLKERKLQLQKNIGLGPDDLVVIIKQEKNLVLSEGIQKSFYHCICGLKMDSPAAFPAYFADLLSRQEKGALTKKFMIKKGRCYVLDSFTNRELVINIQNNGSCQFKLYREDQVEEKIDEVAWRNIQLSSALRFYRGSQPLIFALFGSNPVSNSITRVFFPSALTMEDFVYIAEHHPVNDELQSAVAGALLLSLPADKIISFLDEYGEHFPTLCSHIMRYVPIDHPFATKLVPVLNKHYSQFPDDLEIAIALMRLDHSFPTPFLIY